MLHGKREYMYLQELLPRNKQLNYIYWALFFQSKRMSRNGKGA